MAVRPGGGRAGRLGIVRWCVALLVVVAVRGRRGGGRPGSRPESGSAQPPATVGRTRSSTARRRTSTRPHPGVVVPVGRERVGPLPRPSSTAVTSSTPAVCPACHRSTCRWPRPLISVPGARSSTPCPVLPRWAVPGLHLGPRRPPVRVDTTSSTSPPWWWGPSRPWSASGTPSGRAPKGPSPPEGTPFICQRALGGSIDPRVFTDADGRSWMLWKSDQNIDGSSPADRDVVAAADHGRARAHRQSGPSSWPRTNRGRGPSSRPRTWSRWTARYWVFYSGNWFNQPAYAIGAARCAGPQGPCCRHLGLPLLGSNAQGAGPARHRCSPTGRGLAALQPVAGPGGSSPSTRPARSFITRLGLHPVRPLSGRRGAAARARPLCGRHPSLLLMTAPFPDGATGAGSAP